MDPNSRPMFVSTGQVPYETHAAYLRKYFAPDNTDRWIVIEHRGTPVGTIALYNLSADGSDYECAGRRSARTPAAASCSSPSTSEGARAQARARPPPRVRRNASRRADR